MTSEIPLSCTAASNIDALFKAVELETGIEHLTAEANELREKLGSSQTKLKTLSAKCELVAKEVMAKKTLLDEASKSLSDTHQLILQREIELTLLDCNLFSKDTTENLKPDIKNNLRELNKQRANQETSQHRVQTGLQEEEEELATITEQVQTAQNTCLKHQQDLEAATQIVQEKTEELQDLPIAFRPGVPGIYSARNESLILKYRQIAKNKILLDKARNALDNTNHLISERERDLYYLNRSAFPEERKEVFRSHVQNILVELNSHRTIHETYCDQVKSELQQQQDELATLLKIVPEPSPATGSSNSPTAMDIDRESPSIFSKKRVFQDLAYLLESDNDASLSISSGDIDLGDVSPPNSSETDDLVLTEDPQKKRQKTISSPEEPDLSLLDDAKEIPVVRDEGRPHLLYQPYAQIKVGNPSKNAIQKVCSRVISLTRKNFKKMIPAYEETLREYEDSLAHQTLPKGLLILPVPGLGEGLFLDRKAKPIPKNTFIGFYSGRYMIQKEEDINPSAYLWTVASFQRKIKGVETTCYLDIDAQDTGNFTRFINHSNHPNVKVTVVTKNSLPQRAYYTCAEILPGEQLLVKYGKEYWAAMDIDPLPINAHHT
jgi:hypothetical protein